MSEGTLSSNLSVWGTFLSFTALRHPVISNHNSALSKLQFRRQLNKPFRKKRFTDKEYRTQDIIHKSFQAWNLFVRVHQLKEIKKATVALYYENRIRQLAFNKWRWNGVVRKWEIAIAFCEQSRLSRFFSLWIVDTLCKRKSCTSFKMIESTFLCWSSLAKQELIAMEQSPTKKVISHWPSGLTKLFYTYQQQYLERAYSKWKCHTRLVAASKYFRFWKEYCSDLKTFKKNMQIKNSKQNQDSNMIFEYLNRWKGVFRWYSMTQKLRSYGEQLEIKNLQVEIGYSIFEMKLRHFKVWSIFASHSRMASACGRSYYQHVLQGKFFHNWKNFIILAGGSWQARKHFESVLIGKYFAQWVISSDDFMARRYIYLGWFATHRLDCARAYHTKELTVSTK